MKNYDEDTGLELLKCSCGSIDVVIVTPCTHKSVHNVLIEGNTYKAYNSDQSYETEDEKALLTCSACNKTWKPDKQIQWDWLD